MTEKLHSLQRITRMEDDDSAVNIVDVTILEELLDDSVEWNNSGNYITPEFADYINTDLLANNFMMCSVPKL